MTTTDRKRRVLRGGILAEDASEEVQMGRYLKAAARDGDTGTQRDSYCAQNSPWS
jgi:hypothetical protein